MKLKNPLKNEKIIIMRELS